MPGKIIIARIEDEEIEKKRQEAEKIEERKFVREDFVSSVSGRNVTDKVTYVGIKFDNGGRQYQGLDNNAESIREEAASKREQFNALHTTPEYKSKNDRIPDYLRKEEYQPTVKKTEVVNSQSTTIVKTPISQLKEVKNEEEEKVATPIVNIKEEDYETEKPSYVKAQEAISVYNDSLNDNDLDYYEEKQIVVPPNKEELIRKENEYKSNKTTSYDDIEIDFFSPEEDMPKFDDLPEYDFNKKEEPVKIVEPKKVVTGYDTRNIKQSKVSTKKYRGKYIAPPLSLLKRGAIIRQNDNSGVQYQKNIIDKTLKDFKIGGHVTNFHRGPTVTQFEIMLDDGVKVEKVKQISKNLQKDLEGKTLRIQAPIPGKSTVGIEVPNLTTDLVLFGELMNQEDSINDTKPLNVILGLDVVGKPVVMDITKMPHALVAGTTGSGKSVCINTIILSILYKAHPDDVKLILIDPKLIEFTNYEDIPHLATPVITEPKMACAVLRWAVEEMQRRYELFRSTKRIDITSYNDVADHDPSLTRIPYIIVVIDELADLLMDSSSAEIEDNIQRLAQKARAAGIHIIMATQRPSTDIIKGPIKANMQTRIAFAVNSWVDSQTILDHMGAEQLLGKGDMLYSDGVNETRVQGAFVTLDEIIRVTEYVREIYPCNFMFTQEDLKEKEYGDGSKNDYRNDELFEPIARYIVENNSASINKIQKNFEVGFNRAQGIMEALEEMNIVSESLGSRPRNVLVTIDELEDKLAGE